MNHHRRQFLGASLIAGVSLIAPTTLANPILRSAHPPLPAQPAQPDLPPVLRSALAALDRHSAKIADRERIALADYSQHSKKLRFMLVDVASGRIEKSYLVSHGRGSDPANSGFVQRFSNRPGSNASSSGSFLTGETYVGQHGCSLRLHGLDPENDQAFARAIVIHGADYVDRSMADQHGRIGRSLGCFAVERAEIADVLERLGPGRLLFAAG